MKLMTSGREQGVLGNARVHEQKLVRGARDDVQLGTALG